jgi:hypothetical protein
MMTKPMTGALRGPTGAARKYDVLTALGAWGCAAGGHMAVLALRLITLITARYNWASGELAVGQREVARLWAVDERTVKREFARLRALGLLVPVAAAARGRVAVHALDLAALERVTAPIWQAVGPDFAARMAPVAAVPPAAAGNIVRFPAAETAQGGLWARALARLRGADPATARAWLDPLAEGPRAPDRLTLVAPGRFHADYVRTHLLARVAAAVSAEAGQAVRVDIVAARAAPAARASRDAAVAP